MLARLRWILLGGLVIVGLAYLTANNEPAVEPPPPAPKPKPPAPDEPSPKKPVPRPPCPGPGPCPRNEVGAAVGGPRHQDGTEIVCDLPGALHLKNSGGIGPRGPGTGAGLCVFTSISHSARWQNVPMLVDFRDWMKDKPGGGYPAKVDKMIDKLAAEQNQPKPSYIQVEGTDLEILKLASKTGRMPAVTYSRSPTGRYNGAHIDHMVSLVHADDRHFVILDNNYPGEDQYEWLSPDEFSKVYAPGWAVILLNPAPPPAPRNPEQAEVALPRATRPEYLWQPVPKAPSQQALYKSGTKIGRYDEDLDVFRRFNKDTKKYGPPATCPIEKPIGKNFGLTAGKLCGRERYLFNGEEVTKADAHRILAKDENVPDDAGKYRVTIIGGTDEDRARVATDLLSHPALAYWRDKTLTQSYPAGHWKVIRDGFVQTGNPTIYFQSPTGEVLHRQDDYQGGAEALARAFSKADPNYNPQKDKDLRFSGIFALPKIPWSAGALALIASTIILLPRRP